MDEINLGITLTKSLLIKWFNPKNEKKMYIKIWHLILGNHKRYNNKPLAILFSSSFLQLMAILATTDQSRFQSTLNVALLDDA
jgi:hypothetical protein